MMKNFKNKVAVITGAASGLGRELALVGADLGLKLVLADVQIDELNNLKAELEENEVEVIAMRCDVSKPDDVKTLANGAINRFGKVNLLFNNAGVGAGGFIWEHSLSDWEWVLGVNLWGVIHGVHTFTPLMLEFAKQDENYEGHIINTASIAGLINSPTMGVYNASKHAVVSITETLFHDLQLTKTAIGCSVLCPYFMPTGIAESDKNRPIEPSNKSNPTMSQQLSQIMTKKAVAAGTATPKEVAIKTFDAISKESFYIYSDLNPLSDVKTRMEDIVCERNPGDPYARFPQVKKFIEAKLKRAV